MNTYHWSEVRTFNIPVSAGMLDEEGIFRELRCTLKSESPRRLENCQLRRVQFDKLYVLFVLQRILKQLNISAVELTRLLDEAVSRESKS